MSMNRYQEEIADLHEINSNIVRRQKATIGYLEKILGDQLDRDEEVEAAETKWVIGLLKGEVE
jgi:hypothetical protein